MDPLLKIVLVQTHSELSETDNLRDESELIACEVCTVCTELSFKWVYLSKRTLKNDIAAKKCKCFYSHINFCKTK